MNTTNRLLCCITLTFSLFISSNVISKSRTMPVTLPFTSIVTKAIVDIVYPVGSIFLDATGSLTPPGQGVLNINWQEEPAQGHILMGYSGSGNWAVPPGGVAGNSQSTDPHQLTIAEMPSHTHKQPAAISPAPGGSFGGGDNNLNTSLTTGATGGNQPHTHTLQYLQRYGVKIWKRVN